MHHIIARTSSDVTNMVCRPSGAIVSTVAPRFELDERLLSEYTSFLFRPETIAAIGCMAFILA